MPTFFGFTAMPTTLLNSVLGALPERSLPVRGPDSIALICPMYNEATGARRALHSLFAQSRLPEEIAISINGATDDTHGVVTATLQEHGFVRTASGRVNELPASLECWRRPGSGVTVMVLQYRCRTAKSEAINNLVSSALLRSDRIMLLDGDTILGRDFLAQLRDNFYRLRWVRGRPVVEDYALQSGTVASYVPPCATRVQRLISSARSAEYAFSGLLRRGQVRVVGGSSLWGRSRLFTVVGCGFAARRDVFPMPADTLTEDHDMTLAVQARDGTVERLSPADLDARGLEVVKDGKTVTFRELLGPEATVELRRGGNARFVNEARMATEDPAHLRGYLAQIQRWDGGGLQNALKRALGAPRGHMPPNARFALWSSQVENLLGLLLLFLLPVLLAAGVETGSVPHLLVVLGWWFGLDLLATSAMTLGGFYLQYRGHGASAGPALTRATVRTLRCWLPYMLLRMANPVAYLAAASRVVPEYLLERRAARRRGVPREGGVSWERPSAGALDGRILLAGGGLLFSLAAVFTFMVMLAPGAPGHRATVRLLLRTPHVAMAGHDALPLSGRRGPEGPDLALAPVRVQVPRLDARLARVADGPQAALGRAGRSPAKHAAAVPMIGGAEAAAAPSVLPAAPTTLEAAARAPLSAYCRPAYLDRAGVAPRALPGSASSYRPLTAFELMMLGRLAPIEPYIGEAAAAYDLPPGLLLQVLINESYLDPLAVGQTDDEGLSQVTSDALTLLRGVSDDADSPVYNPHLVSGDFQVFDPDFSICAGAAKLAWARAQPAASDDRRAYALFINPLRGLSRDGSVAVPLLPAVDDMQRLSGLVTTLGSAYAAYRHDPASVTAPERRLLSVSAAVASEKIGLAEAYRRSRDITAAAGIDDAQLYDAVLARLYPTPKATPPANAQAMAR